MKIKIIEDYLDEKYPNPRCELDYKKDYELLIAVVLSAQTTDKRVNSFTPELFSKYDTLLKLKEAPVDDIAKIIKPIGTFNKKSIFIKEIAKVLVDKLDSIVPNNREELENIPGVGRKTANVVLSNAFGQDAMAVDTHVFRVSNRIGIVDTQTPEKTEFALMDAIPKKRWSHSHHLLIFHGRRICKARKPECEICPITKYCKYYKNNF